MANAVSNLDHLSGDANQNDSFDLTVSLGYSPGYTFYSSIADFNLKEGGSSSAAAEPPTAIRDDEPIFGQHIREAATVLKGLFKKQE